MKSARTWSLGPFRDLDIKVLFLLLLEFGAAFYLAEDYAFIFLVISFLSWVCFYEPKLVVVDKFFRKHIERVFIITRAKIDCHQWQWANNIYTPLIYILCYL